MTPHSPGAGTCLREDGPPLGFNLALVSVNKQPTGRSTEEALQVSLPVGSRHIPGRRFVKEITGKSERVKEITEE